jgi:adenosylmethionine---8-amino-7-oxononanoate aminotransferase
MQAVSSRFVDAGVWVRPFGKLIYLMPPYVINQSDLRQLINALTAVVAAAAVAAEC